MSAADRVLGRTALVTGAGSGLGRVISLALGFAGANLILVGRQAQTLDSVAREVASKGSLVRTVVTDVSDPGSVEALQGKVAEEEISILINNAGVAGPVSVLWEVSPDDWDEVFATNVRGTYLMCRAFIPAMIRRRTGDVINIASVSGKRPLAGRTPYTSSKMAVIGLTATLAHEAGPFGVVVNCLSPGPVRGPRMDRNFTLEAERTGKSRAAAEEDFVSRSALGRMIEEEEVGAAIIAMLNMPGLAGADVDLSAGMVAR